MCYHYNGCEVIEQVDKRERELPISAAPSVGEFPSSLWTSPAGGGLCGQELLCYLVFQKVKKIFKYLTDLYTEISKTYIFYVINKSMRSTRE